MKIMCLLLILIASGVFPAWAGDKVITMETNKAAIDAKLLEVWNELPPFFISSSESKVGRDEIWEFIKGTLPN
mgnify:CR=1 FL=1